MKIILNEQEYQISQEDEEKILQQIQAMALSEYEKLADQWRFLAKTGAREILRNMENHVREKHGKEKAMLIRPEKRADPVQHLTKVMVAMLQEAVSHVEIFGKVSTNTITDLSVSIPHPGKIRGQVASDGDLRVRKNDSAEVS